MTLLLIAAVIYIIIAMVLTAQVTKSIGDFLFVLMMVIPSLIPLFVIEYTARLCVALKSMLT